MVYDVSVLCLNELIILRRMETRSKKLKDSEKELHQRFENLKKMHAEEKRKLEVMNQGVAFPVSCKSTSGSVPSVKRFPYLWIKLNISI